MTALGSPPRCQALDPAEVRCRNQARPKLVRYFGDRAANGDRADLLAVFLCAEHDRRAR